MKAIRYENRAELFDLNGNKRPIPYEFRNDVKLYRYNGNMVLNIKGSDYRYIIRLISKNWAINLMQNADLTEKSGTL